MEILIIGTGYVGTTTGLVFCEMGHKVTGLDLDAQKIASLKSGKLHFFEPGLNELLQKNLDKGNISFTTNTEKAIKENDIIFICVGTPQSPDGSADLSYVESVAKSIGKFMNRYKIIINKSTVPVGTAELVNSWIKNSQDEEISFDVVSNPEFLREGSALRDALTPDRIVIGTSSEKAGNILKKLFSNFSCPVVITDPRASELIKYAANSFLALKISYINEIARLCEVLDIDIVDVSRGIGLDKRIGNQFLKAGIGYGGSCFPKDINALLNTARINNCKLSILESAVNVNIGQIDYFIEKIKTGLGGLTNKKLAILGLAFKPNTDDIRDSPAIKIVNELLKLGFKINVHDPVVQLNENGVYQYATINQTIKDVDAIVICTDWECYKSIDWESVKELVNSYEVYDGRNMYNPVELENLGFKYHAIGR